MILWDYIQNVPKSKHPIEIGQNVPMVKKVGQNFHKMIFSIFYEILSIIWDVWMKLF